MKDGGPAFPHIAKDVSFAEGMSLRDYFAAAALPKVTVFANMDDPEGWRVVDSAQAAAAYRIADAMLAEREK